MGVVAGVITTLGGGGVVRENTGFAMVLYHTCRAFTNLPSVELRKWESG